jgi:hypothetical protein
VAIASTNARSSTLPSTAAAPTTSQQTSDTGEVSLTAGSPLVDGGGLIPEIEFGPVGLDLPPHRERPESEQYDHQYLDLHSEEPSASMT